MCLLELATASVAANVAANVSLFGSIASTVMGVGGAIRQQTTAKNMAKYRSQVASNNKLIADFQAQDAIKRGDIKASRHRQKVKDLKGRLRAVMAASGFSANDDDALDILGDTAAMGKQDELTIKSNAEREAYTARIAAQNQENQSLLLKAESESYSPMFAGATSLFGGVGSVAQKWYKYKTA